MKRDMPETAAYGLRFAGVMSGGPALPAPQDWDRWTVERVVRTGSELGGDDMTVWEDRALIPMPDLGRITVERESRRIVFETTCAVDDAALLHPGLVPVAAVVSAWSGRACVHASAVIAGGRVWALLGERGDGKSTTAALLAERGHEFFTDDVLVTDESRCFAGPAAIDLRADASERMGGTYLGMLGRRERWRKSPPPRHTAEAPLGGFVELAWNDDGPGVEALDLPRRLELVGRHATMPLAAGQLLGLAGRPGIRLSRAHDLDRAEEALDLLAAAIGAP